MNEAVRVLFEKTGLSRYISHLDLQHTLQRAFSRAAISVRHSNGFNPHPLMTIALPLPLGYESVCEIMDFVPENGAVSDEFINVMNGALPAGIRFLEAYAPSRKVSEIRWIRTEGFWRYETEPCIEELEELFRRTAIPVDKKTKRGISQIDLAIDSQEVRFRKCEAGIRVTALLSAQSPTVNPDLILKAAERYVPDFPVPKSALYRRMELFDKDNRIFR
ncbi:MAG: TIGR03936 family radical SAM-associated protein [Oscillospiraceae bacterium]|nr:TIGR03936 family radical SAM-associated protein [Oscillospiraceae bacterium]